MTAALPATTADATTAAAKGPLLAAGSPEDSMLTQNIDQTTW